jgi:hypothetical protein
MSNTLVRFIALPILMTAVFVAIRQYYKALGLPLSGVRSMILISILVPHFLLVSLLTVMFSHIAARIYQQQAVIVALLTVLPVLYIRLPELLQPISFLNPYPSIASLTISAFEIGSFTLLLCVGTWLVSRNLSPQN